MSPLWKNILEYGPTLFFVVLYFWIKDNSYTFAGTEYSGFIVATVLFVPVVVVAMAITWRLTGKLSRMQLVTTLMVVFFGGLTAWFNDERFFKMKTSIVYGGFALVLALGLLQKRSYLQWAMGEALPMQTQGWMILTKRLVMFFAGMAVLNELTWRNLDDSTWVLIESFGFPILTFVFLFTQFSALGRYLIEPAQKNS